ncbi:MAG TPA: TIGR02680 family protein [Acidimicrobiales bacterium]|nr:TIGR02680 family protein [Acidimicrobiales bacterium]
MTDTLTVVPEPEIVSPSAPRWQPTRAGLISVWRYWEETFTFHRGRLLLRGPNGAGKSMALELLLPFLLEADSSPDRLSSASKSRGTLFDRVMTGSDESSRTGFAWVEFSRGDEVFTVGARIRGSQATRRADPDFFTTTLAVGRDLHLLDDNRAALSRRALVEAIGSTGRVHNSAEEHRTAVREVLFPDFTADRYKSVVGALRALRKEKLSQNLDLEKLSGVLSEALPPIDDHDIAAVAEGFERLDRRRAELAALESDLANVRLLAARQRDYARAVVVGAAAAVRSAETRRDDVTREERRAREELDVAREKADAAGAERAAIAAREVELGVEIDALKDSDAYKRGAALADLRRQAERFAEVAERDTRLAETRSAEHATAVEELEEARSLLVTASANQELAEREVRWAAQGAGADDVVSEALSVGEPDDAERLVQAWVDARRARIEEVRAALARHERAVVERSVHEERVADDEGTVQERRAVHDSAVSDRAVAVSAYRLAVEDWARSCETIGAERVAAALPQAPEVPGEVRHAVAALTSELQTENALARRELEAEREGLEVERNGLSAERARWAEQRLPEPEAPVWRSDRTSLAGAPLWALVDPRPGTPDSEVDRLEAALAGTGLLDAWVQPDGSVDLGPERADVVLTARPAGAETLGSLVVPCAHEGVEDSAASGSGVPTAVVAEVLASIPLVDTALPVPAGADGAGPEVAVGRDGTYRVGAAVGRGAMRPACLLGAPARERHRLARLEELDTAIAAVDARLADVVHRRVTLDGRRSAVTAELSALPDPAPVNEAEEAVSVAATRLAEAVSRLDAARSALRDAEERVRNALRELTVLAARHALPTDAEGLAAVDAALSAAAGAVVAWGRRRRELLRAERDEVKAGGAANRAEDAAQLAARAAAASRQEADELAGRVAALESSVGVDFGELLARITRLDQDRGAARGRERELGQLIPALERKVGELESTVKTAADERGRAEDQREVAHRRLVSALDDLGTDADIQPEGRLETGSAVLGFARSVAVEHQDTNSDPATIERLSERVRERVHQAQAALGARVDVDRHYVDDGQWWVLRTTVRGMRLTAGDLTTALAGELEQGRAELAAEEEQLFEQTLAGSVRRALADRIRQANDLVDAINAQLGSVRTQAGGVQVRLRWDVDPEQLDAVKAARSLLLRDPADLSDAERDSLQAFVRARVDQARMELEANAPWEARLRETLDYRSWHRFTLQVGHRDWEGFQPATLKRLQRLSTGERSIALHLPMIASVAAHYTGPDGRPSQCPRLILLDELFAGVDSANRAQLFGTFTAWDLDAVLTSDSEWCKYATLDGIAIHHLHPPTGTEPVTSTRFTWDGRVQRVDPDAA